MSELKISVEILSLSAFDILSSNTHVISSAHGNNSAEATGSGNKPVPSLMYDDDNNIVPVVVPVKNP